MDKCSNGKTQCQNCKHIKHLNTNMPAWPSTPKSKCQHVNMHKCRYAEIPKCRNGLRPEQYHDQISIRKYRATPLLIPARDQASPRACTIDPFGPPFQTNVPFCQILAILIFCNLPAIPFSVSVSTCTRFTPHFDTLLSYFWCLFASHFLALIMHQQIHRFW